MTAKKPPSSVALIKRALSREHITALLNYGMTPRTLADALDVPISSIIESLPEDIHYEANDDALRSGLRVLAWRAIEVSLEVFNEGTQRERVQLAKALITPAFYALNKSGQESSEITELRTKLDALLQGFAHGSGLVDTPVDDQDGSRPRATPTELGAS